MKKYYVVKFENGTWHSTTFPLLGTFKLRFIIMANDEIDAIYDAKWLAGEI
jgi:hypothetical protein